MQHPVGEPTVNSPIDSGETPEANIVKQLKEERRKDEPLTELRKQIWKAIPLSTVTWVNIQMLIGTHNGDNAYIELINKSQTRFRYGGTKKGQISSEHIRKIQFRHRLGALHNRTKTDREFKWKISTIYRLLLRRSSPATPNTTNH
jgi:hypothetical protein